MRSLDIRQIGINAAAGLLIVAAIPPWGWWPLAFVGVALLDRTLAGATTKQRFWRTWTTAFVWLAIGMFWMIDLTPPGYVVAVVCYASMFGAGATLAPAGPRRRLALPAVFVLVELVRWTVPFGGVPLATLAMSQVESPLAPTVRVFGSLLLVALTVVVGMVLSALVDHDRRAVGIGIGTVAAAMLLTIVAPTATPVGELDIAIVQGGGEQRTRFDVASAKTVFDRHLAASALVETPVDLVLWPENVVNPSLTPADPANRRTDRLYQDEASAALSDLARDLDAVLLPGWFVKDPDDDTATLNYHEAIEPTGEVVDRYDKERIVPFGEFVPLRGLLEAISNVPLPQRDVRAGEGEAVLETSVGTLGVSISWEIFFERRGRDAIGNGGQILMNPTNGSSYWLTILQTQQVASSQLRAMETDRWVLQAAPTGFSAVIAPDGDVLQRTAISEQAVLHDRVELREGLTWATRFKAWPMVLLSIAALGSARLPDLRRRYSSAT